MTSEMVNDRVYEFMRQRAKQQIAEQKDRKEGNVDQGLKRNEESGDKNIPVYVPKPQHQLDKRLRRKEVASGYIPSASTTTTTTASPPVPSFTPSYPSSKEVGSGHTVPVPAIVISPAAPSSTPSHPSSKQKKSAVPESSPKKKSATRTRSNTAESQHPYVQIIPYGPIVRSQQAQDYNEEECAKVRGTVREGGYGGFMGVDWYRVRREEKHEEM
jgi:hypothetical protein